MSRTLPGDTYFGSPLGHRRAGRFTLTCSRYGPDSELERHAHERPNMGLVIAGAHEERSRSERLQLTTGGVAIHAADFRHENLTGEAGAVLLNVGFEDQTLSGWDRALSRSGSRYFQSPCAEPTVRLLAAEFRRDDDAALLSIESLLLDLLARAGRTDSDCTDRRAPAWLARVTNVLRERHTAPPSLSELATLAEVHRSHLARAFRQWCDCTIGEFVRHVRLDRACNDLRDGNEPVSRIALRAGFVDQSHLSRTMREHLGVSPRRYREQTRR